MKWSKMSKIACPGYDFAFDMLYLWRELIILGKKSWFDLCTTYGLSFRLVD